MALSLTISTSDNATAAVQDLARSVTPAQLGPIIGRSARNTIRAHLFGVNSTRPNALGGTRTNFYASAARGTQFRLEGGDNVVISINQVGIRQRFYGGTIVPKKVTFLTIPAIPEAHGKRAREFDGLVFAIRDGRPALVRHPQTILGFRTRKGVRETFAKRVVEKTEVVFWLARSVTQKPDPTVLPYPEVVLELARRDVASFVSRVVARKAGAPA